MGIDVAAGELRQHAPKRVRETDPEGEAQDEGHDGVDVQSAAAAVRLYPVGRRPHNALFITAIAGVEVLWLVGLVGVVLWLVR
jgi:hypothetical protein